MSEKYYLCQRASQQIDISGIVFRFEQTHQVGGQWWGVYRTDNENEQRILDGISGKMGIEAISLADYQHYLKKKKPSEHWSASSSVAPKEAKTSQDAKSAEVGSEDITPPSTPRVMSELEAVRPVNSDMKAPSGFAANMPDLATMVQLSVPELRTYKEMEGFPNKTSSGYPVVLIKNFIASRKKN